MMRGDRVEIRIAGTGGQGLILAGKMLAEALVAGGWHVAQSQTYEPTSRGGFCNSDVVLSRADVDYPLASALDCLVLLDRIAVGRSWPLLKPGALVLADTRLCPELPEGGCAALHLPMTRTAIELGSERVANIVALGALAVLAELCARTTLREAVLADTPRGFVDLNIAALSAGVELAERSAAARSREPEWHADALRPGGVHAPEEPELVRPDQVPLD
jgi:2-oxoglutarate ferredoxin oxidoreductase subunit gamma